MHTETLPVIDIGNLRDAATRRAIDAACREWGFFQITGHGIDARRTADLRGATYAFFALPLAAKRAIVRSAENPWGFYDREVTRHTRDWKQIYDYGPPDGAAIFPQFPRELPAFASAVRRFYAACETLAFELVEVVAANLGMPPGAVSGLFRPEHTSFLRLNYYPPCPIARVGSRGSAAAPLGVGAHTDAGALTLLLQDVEPGLEVLHDGAWHLVEPRSDAIVVNVGDIVQVWSNDRYRAALHRVVVSADAPRFSVPFFFNPAYSTQYAPLPSTVDARNPPRYRPIHWGRFRARRAAGDYADNGEYHTIHHYAR